MAISVTIRQATIEDLSQCVVMARKFFAVSGAQGIEFDVETCAERYLMAVKQGLCFVAESGGLVIGFILGAAFPSLFNKGAKVGVELAWWVEPEYRKGTYAIKLLKAIEAEARKQGIKAWSMICLESQTPDAVEDIYLRLGYEKAERTFVRYF